MKIYLFLLIAFSTNVFGQELSYSATIRYNANVSSGEEAYASFSGDGDLIDFYEGNSYFPINISYIPNYTLFRLESQVYKPGGSSCQDRKEYSVNQLIKSQTVGSYTCGGGITLTNFKPNNLKITSTVKEICAGDQVSLTALPAGYPNEAYHWQYSLDNQLTWIDVPNMLINNLPTNNSPTPSFTIKNVLGNSHVNYFDKQLYFRLGYENRPFTDPIPITYSACAPVITNLNPIQPNCSGDPMTVIVTFDRPLDPIKNEKLTNFQIIKKTGELTGNQIPEIIAFDTANTLQYTYNNVTGLINGEIYAVKYQAFQGVKEKGVPEIDIDFQYQDPTPLQFEIVSAENPACNNGTVEIVISVKGGTGAYKFYDGTIEIIPTPINGTDGVYHLKNLAPKEYKIKVVDGKGCIDENKYD